jgi:hypothetical protein
MNKIYNRHEDPFKWLPGLDASEDFIPPPSYTDLFNRCDQAYDDILTGDVLNYRLDELKAVLDNHQDLFDEADKQITVYEGFDHFIILYDALISAYQFTHDQGWNAYFALDDYSKFDMSLERHVLDWLKAYGDLNNDIAFHLHFNTDCDCNNLSFYRISPIGIHIHHDDLEKIFEFSRLYAQHYSELLNKYMDITWEEYHALTDKELLYYRRDNLFYYLSKNKQK